MEIAARAGYNPEAGITLWEKMSQAAKGAPPPWLSTHPSGATASRRIKDNLKRRDAALRARPRQQAAGPELVRRRIIEQIFRAVVR